MTAPPPDEPGGVDTDAAVTIDAAARYNTNQLARQRLRETTDPHGWNLARRLAVLADTTTASTLPSGSRPPCRNPRPQTSQPSLTRLFPHGGDTALR